MSNQTNKADPATDRRKKPRYAISPAFRLNATLALCGEADQATGGAWKDWPGTLMNLSAAGANVQLNMGAVAYPNNPCRLKLRLGGFKLEIPGTVAHFVCDSRSAVCGMNFDFSYAGVEKAYYRVLEPVIIGSSLTPVEATSGNSVRYQEQFSGTNSALLTIWREKAGSEVTGFEFQTNHYTVGAEREVGGDPRVRPTLRFKGAASDKTEGGEFPGILSTAQEADLRWQFCLAASNLSAAVPLDVRKFLLSLV